MRLAISNIAWPPADEPAVTHLLQELGVRGLEVAPTAVWPRLDAVTEAQATAYRSTWEARGIDIVALQAILYGRPDLQLFGTAARRSELLAYLHAVFRLAAWLGAGPLVFGSPRNRVAGDLSAKERTRIATDFFRQAGDTAAALDVVLCIEPNPAEYGCDFVQTLREAQSLVDRVDSPGFALHVDSAAMALTHDGPGSLGAGPLPRHFHISEPYLAPVNAESQVDHSGYAAALRGLGYSGWCSIEMRAPDADVLPTARRALEFAAAVYG
ncbi:MAG TPA: TIM barrel protein [Longimicrobiales bacterium]|nr:TIM barrel protein [Longimicrobiales bacterium]